MSSNTFDKYEYLTVEDLDLKPSTTETAKFEYSPLGKFFDKGLNEDDKKEGLLKRLKNIENAEKNLINSNDDDYNDDDDKSIYYTPRSQFDEKKNGLKTTKCIDYLKSLSQEAKELIDEIEDAENDIDIYKLAFIDSNKESFNFNIFRKPLNFNSAIYIGEITLKEAEN